MADARSRHHPNIVTHSPHSVDLSDEEPKSPDFTLDEPSPASSTSQVSLPHLTRSQSQSLSTDSDSGASTERQSRSRQRLSRPALGSRKSSGTIIIPREQPVVAQDEEYDPDDARAMSPRRTSDEIDRMREDSRQALQEQALQLQASIIEITERVDNVKEEHEKLQGGNKFLQSYIGELMQTSKITSAGAPKSKKRGNK